MYSINIKIAGLYFRNGTCCIDRLKYIPKLGSYPNILTDLVLKIGEKDGVAVIKGTSKSNVHVDEKDFLGKKRNDKFINYGKSCGMEQKEVVEFLSKTADRSYLGIKYLRFPDGWYFNGKEEPVEIYTNNYFIQNA